MSSRKLYTKSLTLMLSCLLFGNGFLFSNLLLFSNAWGSEIQSLGLGKLRLNEIQYIGTHNSYHIAPDQVVDIALLAHNYGTGTDWPADRLVSALSYTHPSLSAQLALGIRTFELDIFDDEHGGRYAAPGIFKTINALGLFLDEPFDRFRELDKPGFKVLHMQDIDVNSNCLRFVLCLREIKTWSDSHPGHVPIIMQIEPKSGEHAPVDDHYNPVVALDFNKSTWARFESEILSVFSKESIIKPDDIRGDYLTLKQALKTEGWPTLETLSGKILFILIHPDTNTLSYLGEEDSLNGKLLFANVEHNNANASFAMSTKPENSKHRRNIKTALRQNLLVYTRADANLEEARRIDTNRKDAAIQSGAQLISTDYPFPDRRLSDYFVQFPGGGFVRCNPTVAKDRCQPLHTTY